MEYDEGLSHLGIDLNFEIFDETGVDIDDFVLFLDLVVKVFPILKVIIIVDVDVVGLLQRGGGLTLLISSHLIL